MQSIQGELSSNDWKKWREDTLYFALGVVAIYLGSVASNIKDPFDPKAFIPNAVVIGAVLNYITNVIQNYLRKRNSGV